MKHNKHRLLKGFALVLALLVVAGGIGFAVYTSGWARAGNEALAVYEQPGLRVEQRDGYILLLPEEGEPAAGFVFYPGGLVDEQAYLPYLANVAAGGYLCAVVSVPFHLAVFSPGAAGAVIQAHPDIEAWAVGGHSLGGVMAAAYAGGEGADVVGGLVLQAAYPSTDLSASGLHCLSVTASNDGVLNREKYGQALPNFPADTRFVVIEGGNHAGFGDYGEQKGDNAPTLPFGQQMADAAAYTTDLLAGLAA